MDSGEVALNMQEKLRPVPQYGIPRRRDAQCRGLGQRRTVSAFFAAAYGHDGRAVFLLGCSWICGLWLDVYRRGSSSSTPGLSTRPAALQRQALAPRASAIPLVPQWPRASYLNDHRQLLPGMVSPGHPLCGSGISCMPNELDR